MRILMLLHECPYPADTGPRTHSLGLLKIATGLGECDVVGFSDGDRENGRWQGLQQAMPNLRIRELLPRATGLRAAWGGLQCLADRFPISARPYFRAGLAERLQYLATTERYDVVHVDSFRLCRLTSKLTGVPTVLIPPDAFSLSFRRALPKCRTLGVYLRCLARYQMFRHLEQKYFPRHDLVCPVSPLDGDWLRLHVPQADVREVAIPVADEFFQQRQRPLDAASDPHLVIAGSFIEDCVTRDTIEVIENCLPVIRRAVPKLRVTVWGRVRSAALQRCLDRSWGIDAISWVDDYQAMLQSAWVYLYPQSAMSGIQTKVQQAMAAGIPVVGRTAALRPLRVKSGTDAAIADDNASLTDAVIRLLQDDKGRFEMGQAGRTLMMQRFSSNAVASQLSAAYRLAIRNATVPESTTIPLVPSYVD